MARILIADDDARIRDVLQGLLREHDLKIVTSWPEVAQAIEEREFDLAITDVIMPGFKDLTQGGVRKVFDGKSFPVIFISAYNEQSMEDLPAHMRFVKKPFSMRVLQSHVNRALSDAPAGA